MDQVKTAPNRFASSAEIDAAIARLKTTFLSLQTQHDLLLNQMRSWVLAMRQIEGVRAFLNGATYAPEPPESAQDEPI